MPFLSAAIVFTAFSLASGQTRFHLLAIVAACLSAIFAAFQAGDEGRYVWLSGFVALAVLLNPVAPVPLSWLLQIGLLALSLVSLVSWVHVAGRLVPSQSISQVMHPRETR